MSIEVGDVLHLYFTTIHKPAYKYCIVFRTEPRIGCVLINSELTEFAKSTPIIRDSHAAIMSDECAPLVRDSWIGCADHFGLDRSEAIRCLEANPEFHCGKIPAAVAQRVVDTMNNTERLSVRKRKLGTEQLIQAYNL